MTLTYSFYFLNTDTYSGEKKYSDRLLDNNNNDIFDYLEYEPVLKLTYKLRVPQELKYELDTLNGERLREFIAYKSERRGGIRQGIYRRFLNYSEAYWNDLADAYVFAYREQSFRRKRDFSFLINFSEENISRSENVISSHEMSRYRVFDDLRKLDMMGSVQVKLYKRLFNFLPFCAKKGNRISDSRSNSSSIIKN